jgi:hypothetical protein
MQRTDRANPCLRNLLSRTTRKEIPAIHIGGRWRIKKSTLDPDILRQGSKANQRR